MENTKSLVMPFYSLVLKLQNYVILCYTMHILGFNCCLPNIVFFLMTTVMMSLSWCTLCIGLVSVVCKLNTSYMYTSQAVSVEVAVCWL